MKGQTVKIMVDEPWGWMENPLFGTILSMNESDNKALIVKLTKRITGKKLTSNLLKLQTRYEKETFKLLSQLDSVTVNGALVTENPNDFELIIIGRVILNPNQLEINVKDLDVETELTCGSVKIKLYKAPFQYKCNQNITGENEQGELIWQIEDINPLADLPFSSIRPFDKEKIIAYNWIGMDYFIDIQTDKLELVNKNARPW